MVSPAPAAPGHEFDWSPTALAAKIIEVLRHGRAPAVPRAAGRHVARGPTVTAAERECPDRLVRAMSNSGDAEDRAFCATMNPETGHLPTFGEAASYFRVSYGRKAFDLWCEEYIWRVVET